MLRDITIGLKAALLLILLMMSYMFSVTFFPMPDTGGEQAKTIVPFLLGVIATLIGFYWGNSKKTDSPVDEAAIAAAKEKAMQKIKQLDAKEKCE